MNIQPNPRDIKTLEQEFYDDYAKECNIYNKEQKRLKNSFKKQLKGLINVTGLFNALDDNDSWQPMGIYSIAEYANNKVRIIDNPSTNQDNSETNMTYELLEGHSDIRGISHYYVYQRTSGLEGDSFYGYILYPLKNGKYFKIAYAC